MRHALVAIALVSCAKSADKSPASSAPPPPPAPAEQATGTDSREKALDEARTEAILGPSNPTPAFDQSGEFEAKGGDGAGAKKEAPKPAPSPTTAAVMDRAPEPVAIVGEAPEPVGEVLRAARSDISACGKQHADGSGKLTVVLTVGADGTVTAAKAVSSTITKKALEACALGVVRKLQLKPRSASEDVMVVFQFSRV